MNRKFFTTNKGRQLGFLKLFILLITSLGALVALISPLTSRPADYQIKSGDVARQDYQAPRTITYISSVLTDQKIDSLKSTISPYYLPADPAIARHQIDRLRKSLDYVSLIRNDSFSDHSVKIDDLSRLEDISFSRDLATNLISIDESNWQVIQNQIMLQ